MKRVEGKVAIITGAGSGMGAASAHLLANEGAKIVGTDVNLAGVQKVIDEIKANGGEAIAIKQDVSNAADWDNVFAETKKAFGKVDILVNNAGISLETPLEDVSEADWNRVMNINITSIFLATQKVVPIMKEQGGGSIVNISSMAGLIGNCGTGPYTASKGAVTAFTKATAHDYAKDKIRCNSIHPGYIATAMTKGLMADENYHNWFLSNTPLPYLGEAEDIANAVLFLASDESKFITGIQVPVDGGIVAG